MQISEQELREMVRDAIARERIGIDRSADPASTRPVATPTSDGHPSQTLFALVPAGDGDCIIEPTVRCTHCGYCKSFGY
jgi:hypothetical protein